VPLDAQTREPDVTTRLRVGLFGAGLIGQAVHAPHLAGDHDRWDFVVVADPSKVVREAVAARHDVPNTCATLEEALRLGLDAVVIAVPDAAHGESVLAALDAGVHVLVEKPLVLNVAGCDEILAARGDRVVQVGYMKLYDPATQRFVELLRDGPADLVYLSVETNDPDQHPFVDHIGIVTGGDVDPELIAVSRSRGDEAVRSALGSDPKTSDARAFRAYLGSLVHDVSLAHFVIRSLGTEPPLPLVDAAYWDAGRGVSLDWLLPGDGRAHLEHLNLPGVSDYRERVTAYCRDRILELTFPSPYLQFHPTRLVERRTDGSVTSLRETDFRVSYEEAFRNEHRAFHDSITTGAPVRSSVEAARDDIVALIDAFRLAASKRGRDR
jgi:predicted dehydrogenase